jgi:hypothetical protein
MKNRLYTGVLALSLLALPAIAPALDEGPQVSADGMQLVRDDKRGAIYVDPGVDWGVYSKVMLDDATVAFRRNWQRDQNRDRMLSNRVSDSDVKRIKTGLEDLFDEVFIEELSGKGGIEVVDTAADDVLRITPHIVDLDVYAPDVRSTSNVRSYTESAGSMTLKLEFYDSVTGDLIAVASDRRQSPRHGYMQWSNSVSNKAEARSMLQTWAKALRIRLNEATGM